MFLTRPVFGKAKNKRFWLVPFWKRQKTNVSGSFRFGKGKKQTFLARSVLEKMKNKCFWLLPFWEKEKGKPEKDSPIVLSSISICSACGSSR